MKKFAVVLLLGVLLLSQSEWTQSYLTDHSSQTAAHTGKKSPNDPTLPSED